MELTKRLAEFAACTSADTIPPEAREQAKRAVLDTLGVMLAGSREDASRIVARVASAQGGREEASVIGHGFSAVATEAALVNGTSAHALDFDDVTASMRGHPSVPLLPAILALCDKQALSGSDLLDAYVVGFEVECRLGRAIGEPHYALGWHATSTFGTVGAAAACSRLLRLDAEAGTRALGIAASLASGVQQNFGTMTKALHAGWAARSGLVAATLAAEGLTADAHALEGESGFLQAASGGATPDVEAALQNLGRDWEIISPGIGVKAYPCCYATHRAIDAALDVRAEVDGAGDIEGVRVEVTPGTLLPLIKRLPQTGLEAKFSMEYCIAAALVDGALGLASFADSEVSRPDLRSVMSRTEIAETGPKLDFPIQGIAEVRARTSAGREASARVEIPRGDPQRPLTWEELAAKFRDCAGLVLGSEAVERAISLIERLEDADVRELTAGLST